MKKTPEQINRELLRPLTHTTPRLFLVIAVLGMIVLAGLSPGDINSTAGSASPGSAARSSGDFT